MNRFHRPLRLGAALALLLGCSSIGEQQQSSASTGSITGAGGGAAASTSATTAVASGAGGVGVSASAQASIPKFIETVFGAPALSTLDPAAQDGQANDLMNAFDFNQAPLPPLVLPTRSCN